MSGTKVPIVVPSEDPKKKKKQEEEEAEQGTGDAAKSTTNGTEKEKKVDGKETDPEELSEEDQQLKNELEMLVERLKESNTGLYRPALETLRTLIRTSTSSMTSVPKPLKFLRPLYPDLEKLYETWSASEDKSLFADILSVLAMTYSDTEPRGTLRYRLLSSSTTSQPSEPGSWGHEYIRHLAAELGDEFLLRAERQDAASTSSAAPSTEEEVGTIADLRNLGIECATFLLGHNAEADAVDLMEELEIVHRLPELVDENTYARVCAYMVRCVNLLPPPDDDLFLRTAHQLYLQHKKFPEALALAIRIGDAELVNQDFHAPANPLMKRQLAFICARAGIPMDWVQPASADDMIDEEELPEDLLECLSNTHLSQNFRSFGKELGALDPKSLEDIYKSHLDHTRVTTNVDSARANLAGSFVNAFVNAGFGNDKLMAEAEEGNAWVYKNKGDGMMSAAASLGLSFLWDLDVGLNKVDRYSHSSEEFIKAGALMATGILNCGIRTPEADAAFALLSEDVENKSVPMRTGAIVGLAMAYVGTHRQDLVELLLPRVADDNESIEVASLTALALGFIHVGSCNGEIASTILQALMERDDSDLDTKWSRFMALGLALLYIGKQDQSDATLETLKAIPHPVSRQAQILVDSCSFAGTGNVLKIQVMLHHLTEHTEKKEEEEEKKETKESDDLFQAFAVLGIALVAMGEDIGSDMSLRHFNHVMHYGDAAVRKMVPLALGLVSASNPQLSIMDTLSKYSHDNDLAVALNAILAMGLIGAGTNNARLGQMLRQLAGYYHKEPDCLFMVRIAQGLVHMGKGTLGINPFFLDRSIMNPSAVAGLLSTLVAFSNAKGFILDKSHWMLFFLVTAMQPRFMITLDEELKNLPATVRVGQAVDVVGQAGKPRTISGFQTHQTPVRLGTTERAEMATEEWIPYAHVLEGFVILQKNPGWETEDKMEL